MKKLYVIKDNVGKTIVGCFTAVNMACAVRDLRASVTQMKLKSDLVTLNLWEDSVLYELSSTEDFETWAVSGKYVMSDITQLPKEEKNESKK